MKKSASVLKLGAENSTAKVFKTCRDQNVMFMQRSKEEILLKEQSDILKALLMACRPHFLSRVRSPSLRSLFFAMQGQSWIRSYSILRVAAESPGYQDLGWAALDFVFFYPSVRFDISGINVFHKKVI